MTQRRTLLEGRWPSLLAVLALLAACGAGLAYAATRITNSDNNPVAHDTDNNPSKGPATTWQVTAERFADAWVDTTGGHDAWLDRLQPYTLQPLHEGFAYTDLRALPSGRFVELGRHKPLAADTPTFITEAHYAGDEPTTVEIVMAKTADGWRVTDVRPQQPDAHNAPMDSVGPSQ